MADPNYVDLLKLGRKRSYTWDEIEKARRRLSQAALNAPSEIKRQEAQKNRKTITEAIKKLGRDGFIRKLVEMARIEPEEGEEKKRNLKKLTKAINDLDQVAVKKTTIEQLVQMSKCKMPDAIKTLKHRGIVVLRDEQPQPLETRTAEDIQENLGQVKLIVGGKQRSPKDLYEFLGMDRTSVNANLYAAANKMAENSRKSRSKDARYRSELAGFCLAVFKTEQRRKQYDLFLIGEVLDTDLVISGDDNHLGAGEIEALLKKALEAGFDRGLVIQYIWSWTQKQTEQIRVSWPTISGGPSRPAATGSSTRSGAPPRRGFRFVGRDYYSPSALAAAFAAEWSQAGRVWKRRRRKLLDWVLDEHGAKAVGQRLTDIPRSSLNLDAQLFLMIRALDPNQQSFRGVVLTEQNLTKLGNRAAQNPKGLDGQVLLALHSSRVLSIADQYGPPLTLMNATKVAQCWSDALAAYESLYYIHDFKMRGLPLTDTERTMLIAAATPNTRVTEELRHTAKGLLKQYSLAHECDWFQPLGDVTKAAGPALLAMTHLAEEAHKQREAERREARVSDMSCIGRGTAVGIGLGLLTLIPATSWVTYQLRASVGVFWRPALFLGLVTLSILYMGLRKKYRARSHMPLPWTRRVVVVGALFTCILAAIGILAMRPGDGSQPPSVPRSPGQTGQAAGESASNRGSDARRSEDAMRLSRKTWRIVQGGLARAGFSPGGLDGIPGNATRDALRRWQRAQGLAPTGYLDAGQLATLNSVPEAFPSQGAGQATQRASQTTPGAAATQPTPDSAGWQTTTTLVVRPWGDIRSRPVPPPVRRPFDACVEAYKAERKADAWRCYRTLAEEEGDPRAQHKLGVMIAIGESPESQTRSAVYWWERAAQTGCQDAMSELMFFYFENGDFETAMTWAKVTLDARSGPQALSCVLNSDGSNKVSKYAGRLEIDYLTPALVVRATRAARICVASGFRNCGYQGNR